MLDESSPGHAPATGATAAEAAVEVAAGDSGEFVQSLERGLSVIRAFDADHPRLTLSEVAAATGLSRAAARRFLHTLVRLGYMRTADGRFELYKVSLKFDNPVAREVHGFPIDEKNMETREQLDLAADKQKTQ